MDTTDAIPNQKIKVQLFIYEGDLEYDEQGNVVNKLQQTMEYEQESN